MRILLLLLSTGLLSSCNWFKQKAKDTVNKSGEIVAKTGSEFVDGVSKGVEKTFQNTVIFSNKIKNLLPENIELHSLKLQETETSFAEWYAEDN